MFRRVAFSSVSRAYSTRRLFCAPARTYLTATQTCRSFPIFTSVSSSQFGKRWLSAKEQEPVTVQAEPVEAAASSANTAPEANSGKENNVREQETASKQETQPEDPKPLNEEEHEFQAETRKLLDIVARSLYTDREVFVRELVSNSSDALEKLRHLQAANNPIEQQDLPLEINIQVDEANKKLIIQDSGIGMTKEELINNLGTIARSGTSEYLQNFEGKSDASGIIGQFGVGFYSLFMVASKVDVYSKSAELGSKGHIWTSDGTGRYSVAEVDKDIDRGTKIVAHLRDDASEFAYKQTIQNIIKKYSNFVNFPIKVNGIRVNTIAAIWTQPKNSITEQQHKDFYQFISHGFDNPMYRLHFTTDSPISISSLFYVPQQHMEKFGLKRMEVGVSLFSRQVLITNKAPILPDWLRFIKGVVDSPDLPLNLSREHLQDSALVKRISNTLTRRLLKFFAEEAKRDPAQYELFWKEYGNFFREGLIQDYQWKEEIAKLLRMESSALEEGSLTSLDEYIDRMPESQTNIFYLCVPNRIFAETSPYYEGFRAKGKEVLFLYTNIDEFVMNNLAQYRNKKITSIETGDASEEAKTEKEAPPLSETEKKDFMEWMKMVLEDKASSIKETSRLVSSPAIIVDHESANFRRMMKYVDAKRSPTLPKQSLEVNLAHPVMMKLNSRRNDNPALCKEILHQVFDNALIAAGILDDPRSMLPRLTSLLEETLSHETHGSTTPNITEAQEAVETESGGESHEAETVEAEIQKEK